MPLTGTIVSHDPSLHSGLVMPDGYTQAVSFTEGDVLNWPGTTLLFGERVSFDIIQTSTGHAAVGVVLLEATPASKFRFDVGNWPAAIIGPVMAAATTYLGTTFLAIPPTFAYVVAVNFITLLMFVLVATSPSTGKTNPAEASLFLLALGGGALILFICIVTIHSRLSSEGLLALLFVFMVIQFIVAQSFAPELLNWREWWHHYLSFYRAQKATP
jgi:hypothetical protein